LRGASAISHLKRASQQEIETGLFDAPSHVGHIFRAGESALTLSHASVRTCAQRHNIRHAQLQLCGATSCDTDIYLPQLLVPAYLDESLAPRARISVQDISAGKG